MTKGKINSSYNRNNDKLLIDSFIAVWRVVKLPPRKCSEDKHFGWGITLPLNENLFYYSACSIRSRLRSKIIVATKSSG